jgi:hypothetical protein
MALTSVGITSAAAATVSSGATSGLTGVRGVYGADIREASARADGYHHIDTPTLISTLQAEHITTYSYLILHSPTDWADLVNEFLPAAQEAGIAVWVYVVPPTETGLMPGGSYVPYGQDYVSWAKAIASLANQYSVLKAWVMDDFRGNTSTFTPAYTASVHSAATAIDPALEFFLVLYPQDYDDTFMTSYAGTFDGAIMPYYGPLSTYDVNDLSQLRPNLDAAEAATAAHQELLYLMPYGARLSLSPSPPSAATVSQTIEVGLSDAAAGKLAGVMVYQAPLQPQSESCPSFPAFAQMQAAWHNVTSGGGYAAITQVDTVDSAAPIKSITFTEDDSFRILAADSGYYSKQLRVNGTVVWQQDPAADDADAWTTHTVDVTTLLSGKTSAQVTFLLLNTKGVGNFGLTFRAAAVSATGITIRDGNYTASPSEWLVSDKDTGFSTSEQPNTCDPNRQQNILDAISADYA